MTVHNESSQAKSMTYDSFTSHMQNVEIIVPFLLPTG